MRFLVLLIVCFFIGCGGEKEKSSAVNKATGKEKNTKKLPFDELVFEIIKTKAEDRLSEITLSPEQEKTWRANSKMNLSEDNMSEHSMKMAKMSLPLLHEETAKLGFDWSAAKLVKTRCRMRAADQRELVDYAPDLDLGEIYLEVESKGKIIGIHLDDCALVAPGVHVMGDGMRLMPESKMKRLKTK